MRNNKKALGCVLACVILWASTPIVSKLGQNGLDNYQFLFWSSLLSAIALLAVSLLSGKSKEFFKYSFQDIMVVSALGFLGSFLYYLLLYYGYANTSGLEVLSIQYTWPIFIIIFSGIILKEKVPFTNILAIIIGFLGVLIVLTKGNLTQLSLTNLTTDLVVLSAAAGFGLYSVLSKRRNFEAYSAATYMFCAATVFSFIAMMIFSNFSFPTERTYAPVLANGILVNGISYIFWLKGLASAKASLIAPLVFLTPVLAAILLVAFFSEPFLPAYAIGLGLIVLAGLISK